MKLIVGTDCKSALSGNLFSQNEKSFKIVSRYHSYGKFTIYQFDSTGKIRNIKDGFRTTKKDNDTIIYVNISFNYKNNLLAEVVYEYKEKIDLIAYNKGINNKIKKIDKFIFEYDNNKKIKSYTCFENIFSTNTKKNINTSTNKTHFKYDEKSKLVSVIDNFSQLIYLYDDLNRIKEIKEKNIDFKLTEGVANIEIDPNDYILKKIFFYTNDEIKIETFDYNTITKKDVLSHRKECFYRENKLFEEIYKLYSEESGFDLYQNLRFSYSENGLINEIFYNKSDMPTSILLEPNINLSNELIKSINDIILNNGISIFGHETLIIHLF